MNSNTKMNRYNVREARRFARAFSLVELLVVIAISTILLALLFGPVISSFNLTRRARAVAQAQDAARNGLERLAREIGQATYIYDNGMSPVAIPFKAPGSTRPDGISVPADDTDFASWPTLSYARIDIVQAATRTNTADTVIDPTTGEQVNGRELLPGVRGRRVVRYFLGLRYPNNANGTQRYYQNVYEFPTGSGADSEFNPVVLYRAEYDPKDPNLFDITSTSTYNSNARNSGGFNDPVFFYSTKLSNTAQKDVNGTAANGKSYGANWQAISRPVLTSQNVDLIRWNRSGAATNRGQITLSNPFTPTVSFAPSGVPGDIAAPGFLTSGGVETASAVPTLYTTKFGAWSYPYRVTVLRGSTGYSSSGSRAIEPFGTLSVTVNRDNTNGLVSISEIKGTGSLASATAASTYGLFSLSTRKLFIKTPDLTFAIDTDRGRIETAFPPLLGIASGAPYYTDAGSTVSPPPATALPAGSVAYGDLVTSKFQISTRDTQAGVSLPRNQGLLSVDLFSNNYVADTPIATGSYSTSSPLTVFGTSDGTVALRGVRIVPGSERITAPVASKGAATTWVRTPFTTPTQPSAILGGAATAALSTRSYNTPIPDRKPVYSFDYDFIPNGANANLANYGQIVNFDTADSASSGTNLTAAGLPAENSNVTANTMEATYLWQNNYSRDPNKNNASWGLPLDSTGAVIAFASGIRPEADVFRVDYATRSQYSIALGARVYDPSSSQVQTIQVTDKVLVNNALR